MNMTTTDLAQTFYTDDYPRNGCRIEIDIPEDGHDGRGWSVSINRQTGRAIESYCPKNLDGALLVARCLATGKRVPLDYHYGKPSGSPAIEAQHDRMQANNKRMFGSSSEMDNSYIASVTSSFTIDHAGGHFVGEPLTSTGIDVQVSGSTPDREVVRVDVRLDGPYTACFQAIEKILGLFQPGVVTAGELVSVGENGKQSRVIIPAIPCDSSGLNL